MQLNTHISGIMYKMDKSPRDPVHKNLLRVCVQQHVDLQCQFSDIFFLVDRHRQKHNMEKNTLKHSIQINNQFYSNCNILTIILLFSIQIQPIFDTNSTFESCWPLENSCSCEDILDIHFTNSLSWAIKNPNVHCFKPDDKILYVDTTRP